MSKEARRLPHSHQGRRGALFYASISIVMPDLNSTVKWSAKTVIFSMSFFTRVSLKPVMSVSCPVGAVLLHNVVNLIPEQVGLLLKIHQKL